MWSGAEYEHNCFDGPTFYIQKPSSSSQKDEKTNPCWDDMNHKYNLVSHFKVVQYDYPLNARH